MQKIPLFHVQSAHCRIISHLIVRLSDRAEDMHGLGRISFQKVVYQAIQQHGPSIFKANREQHIMDFPC